MMKIISYSMGEQRINGVRILQVLSGYPDFINFQKMILLMHFMSAKAPIHVGTL